MSADPFGPILLLAVLAFFAFCVRAANAALPFLDEADLKKRAGQGSGSAKRLCRLFEMAEAPFNRLEAAYLMLAMAFAFAASMWLGAPLKNALFDPSVATGGFWAGLILFFASTLFLYTLSAQLADQLAAHRPEGLGAFSAMFALLAATLCSPPALLCVSAARMLLKPLHFKSGEAQEHVTEEEIRMMVDIGEEKGTIESDEKEMIENIFEFNNMTAEDCMIHRKDITAIDVEDTDQEILSAIRESGLSRFPVFEEDIDNVVGILTSRDYLLNRSTDAPKPLKELIRPAHFVPESVRTDVLFREMQRRKQHMAIVVDEYGGTSGLITLEDLLEEIVGNIYDEFDPKEEQDITPLPDGRYRVTGSTELETLGEALGMELEGDEECDTLGGLVFSCLTEIPADGEKPVVEKFGLKISVEEIADRRVEWAIVEKLPQAGSEEH